MYDVCLSEDTQIPSEAHYLNHLFERETLGKLAAMISQLIDQFISCQLLNESLFLTMD